MHERLHELQFIDRCEWRGVQHAPHLPRPMRRWQGSFAAELRHEVEVVRRLVPHLPITPPSGKPNTGLAIEWVAWCLQKDRRHGMELVRRLYQAFWRDGRDISDPQELAEIINASKDGANHEDVQRLVKQWEEAWHATGQAGVPLLLSSDGALLVGCVPGEQIVKFFSHTS